MTSLEFEKITQRRLLQEAEQRAANRRQEREERRLQQGPESFLGAPPFLLASAPNQLPEFAGQAPEPHPLGSNPADAGQTERLFGQSIVTALGDVRKGTVSGINNPALKAAAFPFVKLGQGALAALEWSGNVGEDVAQQVTLQTQRFIPGRQHFELLVAEKMTAGHTYGDAVNRAWEETNLELFAIPFAKTAFTPNGSITVDAKDVIAAGFDPIDLILTLGTGGLGGGLGVAGVVTGKQSLKAGIRTAVGQSVGVRGGRAVGRFGRAAVSKSPMDHAADFVTNGVSAGLKGGLADAHYFAEREGRSVGHVPALDVLEEQAFRSDGKQAVVDRIVKTRIAGKWARRIIGLGNPAAVAGDNVAAQARVVYESAGAIGANMTEVLVDVITARAGGNARKIFDLDEQGFVRSPGMGITPHGEKVFKSRGIDTSKPLHIGDVLEGWLGDVADPGRAEFKSLIAFGDPRMQVYADEVHRTMRDLIQMAVDEGLFKDIPEAMIGKKFGQITEQGLGDPALLFNYVHRRVIGKMDESGELLEYRGKNTGAAKSFEQHRTYEFATEAAQDGTLYDTIEDSVRAFGGTVYRMIAEKRAKDLVNRSGQLVTSKQVMEKLYSGVSLRKSGAEAMLKKTTANVNRLKGMRARRAAKAPLLREAEQHAGTVIDEIGRKVDESVVRHEKSFLHGQQLYESMRKAKNDGSRRRLKALVSEEAGKIVAQGQETERLISLWKANYVRSERARRKVAALDSDQVGVTSNLMQAEAEMDLARMTANRAATAYTRQMNKIMRSADLDAAIFGGEEGKRVAVNVFRDGPLSGSIAPKDMGDILEGMFKDRGSDKLRKVEAITGTARTLSSGLDIGWLGIQGSLLLVTNPVAYVKAAKRSLQAVKNPELRAKYITENLPDVLEFLEAGGDLGSSEFFQAIDRTGLISRVEDWVFRKTEEGSMRSNALRWWGRDARPIARLGTGFNAFLDTGKIELWKSLRGTRRAGHVTDRELASHINNLMGTMNSRMLGVTPTQRQIEGGLLLFSPRYTRSAFALAGELLQKPGTIGTLDGLAQREAIRAMGGMIAAATTVIWAIGETFGEEPELNPFKPGWLTVTIGGQSVGVGGSARALLDLMFKGIAAAAGIDDRDPSDLLDLNIFDPKHRRNNPMIQYWLNRTAPGVREVITRETFDGEKLDSPGEFALRGLAPKFLPFALQAYAEPPQGVPRQSLTAFVPEQLGLRARPMSAWERLEAERNKLAQEAFDKPWIEEDGPGGISLDEQAQLRRDFPHLRGLEEAVHATSDLEMGAYFNQVESDRQYVNDRLENITAELFQSVEQGAPNGPSYREKHDAIMREAFNLRQRRDDPDGEYAGALKRLKESRDRRSESQTDFNILVDQYAVEVKNNPLYRDDFGNPNFDAIDQAEKKFRAEVGEEMYARVRNFYRGRDPDGQPLRQEYAGQQAAWALRVDRDTIQESGYWDIPRQLLDGDQDSLDVWNYYQSLDDPVARESMKRRFRGLIRIEKQVEIRRQRLRRENADVDQALVRWYGYRAVSREGRQVERERARELRGAVGPAS